MSVLPSFRVLETADGVTLDVTVTIDRNSAAFTGGELAELYTIDNPRSTAGREARQAVREALPDISEAIVSAIASAEEATSDKREKAATSSHNTAYDRGWQDMKKCVEARDAATVRATQEQLNTLQAELTTCRESNDALRAQIDSLTASASEEAAKLTNELNQLRAERDAFKASEAERARLAAKRRNQRAAQRAKAKPAQKTRPASR